MRPPNKRSRNLLTSSPWGVLPKLDKSDFSILPAYENNSMMPTNNSSAKSIKVLLASPSYDGKFDVKFMESLTKTILAAQRYNIEITPLHLCYDSLVQRVRNNYFKIAYDNNFDVMFFIDADIGWYPEDFIKLVLSDKDMIGGGYRKKQDDEELYAFKVKGDTSDTFEIVPDEKGILEVNGLGCGFLKMSYNCIKKLYENETNYYKNDTGVTKIICDCVVNDQKNFISEDIILGFKWQQLGGKVYIDTNIRLSHVGSKSYEGNVKSWLDNWKKKFENGKNVLDNYLVKNIDDELFKIL